MGAKLKSDTGEPLEVKEGVLLDQEGNPILDPALGSSSQGARVFMLRGGLLPSLLLGILIPVLFVVGFTFIAALLAAFIAIWIIARVVGMFRRL